MSSVSCLQTGSFGALLDKWMEKKKDMHGKAEQERIKKWQQEKGENPVSEIVKLLKRGESEKVEFIDMKVFGRDIIDQREDALEFVKEHIKLHAEIKGTERVER